ncbi:response regulator transcription factor [Actinomyces minihominis]|uniref:response regulator transcription factor n=1 Tax=Actinomyces minihominis TaxID=2002838 RepID=UPI0013EC418C|nr:response regulator transcription factor [Actinomyces minihominis]
MCGPKKIRVAVADDDPELLPGLVRLLGSEPDIEVVLTAANGVDLLNQLRVRRVDVVLLDVDMPYLDGLSAARRIAERFPKIAIIMLTAFEERDSLAQALAAGARGFLTKDVPISELCAGIRRVLAGETVMAAEPVRLLADAYRRQTEISDKDRAFSEAVAALPERLVEVLNLLVEGSSNRTISKTLGLSEGTTRNYVSEVLSRMGCERRTQVAVRALRAGYAPPDNGNQRT